MGVLKDLESFVINMGELREAGIPSVSMAFLDNPLSPVSFSIMSCQEEMRIQKQSIKRAAYHKQLACSTVIALDDLNTDFLDMLVSRRNTTTYSVGSLLRIHLVYDSIACLQANIAIQRVAFRYFRSRWNMCHWMPFADFMQETVLGPPGRSRNDTAIPLQGTTTMPEHTIRLTHLAHHLLEAIIDSPNSQQLACGRHPQTC